MFSGAGLNCSKSFFKDIANDGIRSYSQLIEWSNGSGSDLIAMLNVYNVWAKLHNQKKFGTDDTRENLEKKRISERLWADKYCIELTALYECQQQIVEIQRRLDRLGIKQPTGVNQVMWTNNEKSVILKIVIAGNMIQLFD